MDNIAQHLKSKKDVNRPDEPSLDHTTKITSFFCKNCTKLGRQFSKACLILNNKKRVKGSKNVLTFISKIVEDVGARISFAKVLSQMKKCRPKKIWPIFVKLVSMSSRRARS